MKKADLYFYDSSTKQFTKYVIVSLRKDANPAVIAWEDTLYEKTMKVSNHGHLRYESRPDYDMYYKPNLNEVAIPETLVPED